MWANNFPVRTTRVASHRLVPQLSEQKSNKNNRDTQIVLTPQVPENKAPPRKQSVHSPLPSKSASRLFFEFSLEFKAKVRRIPSAAIQPPYRSDITSRSLTSFGMTAREKSGFAMTA